MSPQKRIRPILRKVGAVETAAAKAQLRLLEAMRRAILAELGNAAGFRRWSLEAILAAIDREVAKGISAAVGEAARATMAAYGLGEDLMSAMSPESVLGVSRALAQAAIEVTTDQVRAVWTELGSRLKQAVRRVTLGVTDPFEGIKAVAQVIRNPKTFGDAFTRAETIIRTETNRTFSLASWKRMGEAADLARGFSVRKYWLTAGDQRVREDHKDAGEVYSITRAIPWDEDFIVGGEALRFPLDPRGSAQQTINCRCVSVPVVVPDEQAA